MRINQKDRAELLALSRSESMRNDAAQIANTRHNPFLINGEVSTDRVVEFLTQYNEFMNHPIKPLIPPIERNMKL